MANKIRVLIVDDSSVIRTMLSAIFSADPELEVVGMAPDPYVAREKVVSLKPDVMTLDIEMPRMDGITFLEKIMRHFPIPTVIISSLSQRNSATALRALEIGAVEVLAKPAIDVNANLTQMAQEIVTAVKAAARAKVRTPNPTAPRPRPTSVLAPSPMERTTHQILAIASSTGGTEALKALLPYLPADLPGTLIVQHMPPVFTRTYAEALQKLCPFEVREAQDGDRVVPGRVFIAPGNFHMELKRSGAHYLVRLHQEPPMHGVRPAADYLLKSVAKVAGRNAIGVVLTGMGVDGALGLREMKEAGAYNLAQDEESCVVFGMPKAAIEAGAIHRTLPLDRLADEIIKQMQARDVA